MNQTHFILNASVETWIRLFSGNANADISLGTVAEAIVTRYIGNSYRFFHDAATPRSSVM